MKKALIVFGFILVIGWAYFAAQSVPLDAGRFVGVAISTIILVGFAIVEFTNKNHDGLSPRMFKKQASINQPSLRQVQDVATLEAGKRRLGRK